ncbi:hypothetical protein [Clostridium estertheticum]|uniref:hypothetical protein n=1 Tax=Clostridium estertheticum TaxID=238834 RepID=UPI001C7D0BF7|nr:hypothetical protein [Clostridium estertheticum]MBX4271779.1 hypothetical protein [Clostridium estertheticum]WLC82483.1 hypothetical protein KTC98_24270 [Clostridium estertheticum]
MYTYEMKFSILKPSVKLKEVKDTLSVALDEAKEEYNKIYIYKNSCGRFIRSISIDTELERILICLESTDRLLYPSKSIAKFTRLLVSSDKIDELIHNKRLFVCDEVIEKLDKTSISSEKLVISDSQAIGILARWVIDSSSDSSLMQKRKRDVIDSLKEKMREILPDEKLIEDWGL